MIRSDANLSEGEGLWLHSMTTANRAYRSTVFLSFFVNASNIISRMVKNL